MTATTEIYTLSLHDALPISGIIAALCSQFKQVNPNILTALAAYIHALAGDQAAKSGERGIIATDLFKELKHIINP